MGLFNATGQAKKPVDMDRFLLRDWSFDAD